MSREVILEPVRRPQFPVTEILSPGRGEAAQPAREPYFRSRVRSQNRRRCAAQGRHHSKQRLRCRVRCSSISDALTLPPQRKRSLLAGKPGSELDKP